MKNDHMHTAPKRNKNQNRTKGMMFMRVALTGTDRGTDAMEKPKWSQWLYLCLVNFHVPILEVVLPILGLLPRDREGAHKSK